MTPSRPSRRGLANVPMIGTKYRWAASVLRPGTRSLLDVGCRDGELRRHLDGGVGYTGIDLTPGASVSVVCDVESGLPFPDHAFDAVVALDVLEHTDDIWRAFGELVRTARQQIVVMLPNLYHWSLRLQYLRGAEMGKYRLPADRILDRHRWLVSYDSSLAFCRHMAAKHGLAHRPRAVFRGRRFLPLDATMALVSKNLGAWALLSVFDVPAEGPARAPAR